MSSFSHWCAKAFSSKWLPLKVDVLLDRKIYSLHACPCIFQPGNCTSWSSEGVNWIVNRYIKNVSVTFVSKILAQTITDPTQTLNWLIHCLHPHSSFCNKTQGDRSRYTVPGYSLSPSDTLHTHTHTHTEKTWLFFLSISCPLSVTKHWVTDRHNKTLGDRHRLRFTHTHTHTHTYTHTHTHKHRVPGYSFPPSPVHTLSPSPVRKKHWETHRHRCRHTDSTWL